MMEAKQKKKHMICKKCGSSSFCFRWEYEESEETSLLLCHPGYGFQLEDSIITCSSCGTESNYEEEDFIGVLSDEELEKKRKNSPKCPICKDELKGDEIENGGCWGCF